VTTIRTAEVALFFRRLHTMLQAGISLPDGLAYLEKGEANPAFRQVLAGCVGALMGGHPFSSGMKKYPEVFSPLVTEMVANGESTGGLAQTLGQLATLQERRLERRQRVKAALTYPLCLLVVMLLVVGLFVTVVSPGDQGLFGTLGKDIPWPSQVLITVSKVITSPVLLFLLVGTVTVVVLIFRRTYNDSTSFRLAVDAQLLSLPVVGKLISRLEAARCLEVLASSLSVGLSVLQGLKNAIRVTGNDKFRRDLVNASKAITHGDGLGVALARNTTIPRFATSLIEVAEESGNLDRALDHSARILDEDVNDALGQAVALAEPVLLCLGGLAAGFVAVATFLPIMRLISDL
jgi:type IV pilus assembly protein PilC